MRKIKFRGKDIISNEWVYGDLVQHTLSDGTSKKSVVQPLTTYDVLPESVGQFTGLIDKNGKEIYEGDRVAVNDFTSVYFTPYTGEVQYHRCGWYVRIYYKISDSYIFVRLSFDDFADKKTEVIGNIYDKP